MGRVPVPDDYEGDHILVCGTADHHYPVADVQVDAENARSLQIREDDEGRYCGPPEQYEQAVAAHLGVDLNQQSAGDDPKALVKDGVCPWCDDYEGDGVPQHASSAHPDEWADYKEGSD